MFKLTSYPLCMAISLIQIRSSPKLLLYVAKTMRHTEDRGQLETKWMLRCSMYNTVTKRRFSTNNERMIRSVKLYITQQTQ